MTKRLIGSQSRRHVHILDEDWEYLMRMFGRNSSSRISGSEAIRTIIHAAVKKLRARADSQIEQLDSGQGPEGETKA